MWNDPAPVLQEASRQMERAAADQVGDNDARVKAWAELAGTLAFQAIASDAMSAAAIAADDVVVSNYAFHHLDHAGKQLALTEARRILQPGGRLVIADMMFGLSLRDRDRHIIASKIVAIGRRGPAGLWRIARNGALIATGRWEHLEPPEAWRRMLEQRRFENVDVSLLAHESGVACARRPVRDATA